MSNQTFPLDEDQIELIHRVFGGTKIIQSSVRTVNTGGYFMNDLYNTECGHIVMVYEYGAIFYTSIEEWQESLHNKKPQFNWDEPLRSFEKL